MKKGIIFILLTTVISKNFLGEKNQDIIKYNNGIHDIIKSIKNQRDDQLTLLESMLFKHLYEIQERNKQISIIQKEIDFLKKEPQKLNVIFKGFSISPETIEEFAGYRNTIENLLKIKNN